MIQYFKASQFVQIEDIFAIRIPTSKIIYS